MAETKRGRKPKAPEKIKGISFKVMLTSTEYDHLTECAKYYDVPKSHIITNGIAQVYDDMMKEKKDND